MFIVVFIFLFSVTPLVLFTICFVSIFFCIFPSLLTLVSFLSSLAAFFTIWVRVLFSNSHNSHNWQSPQRQIFSSFPHIHGFFVSIFISFLWVTLLLCFISFLAQIHGNLLHLAQVFILWYCFIVYLFSELPFVRLFSFSFSSLFTTLLTLFPLFSIVSLFILIIFLSFSFSFLTVG